MQPAAGRVGLVLGEVYSTTAGTHLLHVQLRDEHLPGSPFCIPVPAARAHPSESSVQLTPSAQCMPGKSIALRIFARDRFGLALLFSDFRQATIYVFLQCFHHRQTLICELGLALSVLIALNLDDFVSLDCVIEHCFNFRRPLLLLLLLL